MIIARIEFFYFGRLMLFDMNEYVFFTLEGETIAPNDEVEVDNCQLLGRVCAHTVEDARNILAEENPWIEEAGFSIDESIHEQVITPELLSDIRVVLDFLQAEVLQSAISGNNYPPHIVASLNRLQECIG